MLYIPTLGEYSPQDGVEAIVPNISIEEPLSKVPKVEVEEVSVPASPSHFSVGCFVVGTVVVLFIGACLWLYLSNAGVPEIPQPEVVAQVQNPEVLFEAAHKEAAAVASAVVAAVADPRVYTI